MATNPNPTLELTTTKGVTRTLDDWSTMFHLCLVILPPRPQASVYVPIAERIFKVFGDADCRTAFCYLTFVDPDGAFVKSLGLTHLPAFVHLRQDTTLVASAEGWHADEWQRVAKEVATAMAWSYPEIARPGDPPPTPGWAV